MDESNSGNVDEFSLMELYEDTVGRLATYKRNGKMIKTRDYINWKKIKLNIKDDDEIPDAETMANEIMDKNNILFPEEYKNFILVYKNGIYVEKTTEHVEKVIVDYFREKGYSGRLTNTKFLSYIRVIQKYIKADCKCSIKEFDTYEGYGHLINCKNGVIDISDFNAIKLLPHSPEYKMRIQIPINYDQDATCPKIYEQVQLVMGNNEKNMKLYFQNVGDGLLGNPGKFKKILILTGETGAAKSSLLYFIEHLYGSNNVTSHSLQDIQDDKYVTAELENKLANIYGDLPRKYMDDGDKIKMATEPSLKGSKKYDTWRDFINHCKHFFSTNQLGIVGNVGDAFYRRFIVILCYRNIKPEDVIRDYERSICTPEELSGFLNLALQGLKELTENEGYIDQDVNEIEDFWEQASTPLRSFIDNYIDYYEYDGEHKIDIQTMFNVYNQYRKKMGLSLIKKDYILSRKLKALRSYKITTERKTVNKKKYTFCLNIEFNEKAYEVFDMNGHTITKAESRFDPTEIDLDAFGF